ncbi:MAG: TerB family tellurite resistance protein [Actinomycetota bacterium]|nr:TerB family tellurite resistance protein [Actinomycetota bacterium]
MNERLAELYRGVAVHATADREHEAALELLALVMMADRRMDPTEVEAIRDISDDWRGTGESFEHYLAGAVDRARAAVEGGRVVEMIADIDARISSTVLRRALFSAAREVADADHEDAVSEDAILAEVAVRFG